MGAEPPAPRSRRTGVIVAAAAVAVAVLAASGAAVYFATREDSGVLACQRIDGFTREFVVGGRPEVSEAEARRLADQLAASGHESLARIGEVFQLGYQKNDPERPIDGMRGAVLLMGAEHACRSAGVPMTRLQPSPR
ncbi:hypothetical protein J2S43_002113 [Catenuloplanes nepalensis]|uniref:DUF732 domain-containing protein n=1 Tax=Catenuloplanes nepalensis TaxID=587533 RepID=A0ABT9MQ95_9ACTN|nr:hypothetical protein [Catenuloplanes nepalensis]MDP9793601.1 hypothetical protein [Catenuloplanes nepalensis]